MAQKIVFRCSEIPPSVNSLYFNRGGRRVLSSSGRAFKRRFVSNRGGVPASEIMCFTTEPTDMWLLDVKFYLKPERIFNKGWPRDGRVKSPFKNLDVSNLIKVTEDAISELIGVRDFANFAVKVCKEATEDGERIEATLEKIGAYQDYWGRNA